MRSYNDYSAHSLPRYGRSNYLVPTTTTTKFTSTYNLGSTGGGASSSYRSHSDYTPSSKAKSYSYASGLSGSSLAGSMNQFSTYRSSPAYPRYGTGSSRKEDYSPARPKLYGSLDEAHGSITRRSVYTPSRATSQDGSVSDSKYSNIYAGVLRSERRSVVSDSSRESSVSTNGLRSSTAAADDNCNSLLRVNSRDFDYFYDKYVKSQTPSDKEVEKSTEKEMTASRDQSVESVEVDSDPEDESTTLVKKDENGNMVQSSYESIVMGLEEEQSMHAVVEVDKIVETDVNADQIMKSIEVEIENESEASVHNQKGSEGNLNQDSFDFTDDQVAVQTEKTETKNLWDDFVVESRVEPEQVFNDENHTVDIDNGNSTSNEQEDIHHSAAQESRDDAEDIHQVSDRESSDDRENMHQLVDEESHDHGEDIHPLAYQESRDDAEDIHQVADQESHVGRENMHQLVDQESAEDGEDMHQLADQESCDQSKTPEKIQKSITYRHAMSSASLHDGDESVLVREHSAPANIMACSTTSSTLWNDFDLSCRATEDEETDAEDTTKSFQPPPWLDFEVDYNDDDDDDGKSGTGSAQEYKPQAWEQFCSFDAGEDEEEEEEDDEEEPVKPPARRFSIQIKEDSEIEDEEAASFNVKLRSGSTPQIKLLMLPADAAVDTSNSEYESENETKIDAPKMFSFLQQEIAEDRGRVEAHLAVPAPVFNIQVTYDSDYADEEESVASVSDYEDMSEEDENEEPMECTPSLPQLMVNSTDASEMILSDYQEQSLSQYESAYDADISRPISMLSTNQMVTSIESNVEAQIDRETEVKSAQSDIFVDAPTMADQEVSEFRDEKVADLPILDAANQVAVASDSDENAKSVVDSLRIQSAKSEEEAIPVEKTDRFVVQSRRPSMDYAMVRTVKAVNELVTVTKIPVHVAPAHAEIPVIDVKELPPVDMVQPDIKQHLVGQRLTNVEKMATYVKQQLEDVKFDRADRYERKRPVESWARKSLVQPLKQEKLKVVKPDVRLSPAPGDKKTKEPDGKSFEEQMEELRSRMKYGSNQLAQQVKDLRKGMTAASTTTKLTAEQESIKDLVKDATQLRDSVNKKVDKWREESEAERLRRETESALKAEKLATQKANGMMTISDHKKQMDDQVAALSAMTNDRHWTSAPKLDADSSKARPKVNAFGRREPMKVASPFVALDKETIKKTKLQPMSDLIPKVHDTENRVPTKLTIDVEKKVQENKYAQKIPDTKQVGFLPKILDVQKTIPDKVPKEMPAAVNQVQSRTKEAQKAEIQSTKVRKADVVEQGKVSEAKFKAPEKAEIKSPTSNEAKLINHNFLAKEEPKIAPKPEPSVKKTKKCFKCRHRHNKFIGKIRDIDEMLSNKENRGSSRVTFDQLELLYQNCSRDRRSKFSATNFESDRPKSKQKKIYIWNITNIDDLYNKRDLQSIMAPMIPGYQGQMQHFFADSGNGSANSRVEDSALQIYKNDYSNQSDYGSYLDSDLSLSEQPDELAALKDGQKTSLVLRTQLSTRVKIILGKLLNSKGKDLRRVIFLLKQIFQDDKDLVHEFVQNDGLACLRRVNSEVDPTYQNYILRAVGQVMLYVDGMNGVIAHNETVQWLYSLLGSQYRLVVKTALKLLLVFVEYTESNALLLLAAVYLVDRERNSTPWSYLMQILNEKENNDLEMFTFAMSLINKTLNSIPDQDTFFDIVDALEEQGLEITLKRLSKTYNKELSDQCKLYQAILSQEDFGNDESGFGHPEMAKMRASMRSGPVSEERRNQRASKQPTTNGKAKFESVPEPETPRNRKASISEFKQLVKPSLQQQNSVESPRKSSFETNSNTSSGQESRPKAGPAPPAPIDLPYKKHSVDIERQSPSMADSVQPDAYKSKCPPPRLPDLCNDIADSTSSGNNGLFSPTRPRFLQSPNNESKKAGAVHSLPEKIKGDVAGSVRSPTMANGAAADEGPGGTFADALSKARRGMEKKLIQQQPADNRRESEVQWERAMENLNRPLIINDLDFTELEDMDDCDPLRVGPARLGLSNGAPVPPPPMGYGMPPPPNSLQLPPPPSYKTPSPARSESPNIKDLRTVKLFWKEAQLQQPSSGIESKGVFWQKVKPVDIDTEKVIQLFETKSAKDVVVKKKEDKKHEILVLDTKRSNAINIGLTKLPPPRAIKTAIVKFDSTILNKECLEKILATMIPSEEEKEKIALAQSLNPDLPLGSAEQFLMLLGEVPVLYPRLKLWLFMLDYASTEKEVAEPLMNLKLAMEELEQSRTFQNVMGTLLAVGNILNGAEVKGFQLEFLAKVPEIKDTIYKHSLVYHLCAIVMDKFPDSTDLFSELGAIARCSKVDFDEIQQNLEKLEKDCKSSWDYLKALSCCQRQENYPTNSGLNKKIGEFLSDCAQRIMTLKVIHRRVINRFRKFLLYMGIPQNAVKDTKINSTCKTIAEFALEYRTCRDKILQQKKRQMDKRERNKTRGKMITENLPVVAGVSAQPARRSNKSDQNLLAVNGIGSAGNKQEALNKVLNSSSGQEDEGWRSFPGVRLRHRRNFSPNNPQPEYGESADDEIIDGLVKAATVKSDQPREQRRKARQFSRKSLRRTRTLKLVEDQIGSDVH